MAAKNIIQGRDLMLFSADGHSYAYATNHTLTMSAETTSVASKDHGRWGSNEVSQITWEITSENLYTTEDYDSMFQQMTAGQPITIRFGLKNSPSDPDLVPADGSTALPYWTSQNSFYQGRAIITSLVANANNGENATYQITLQGNSKLQKVTLDVSTGN